MEKALLIELTAIVVGIVVIVIETVIIFLLLNHIRIMKHSFEESRIVIQEFRNGISEHLQHMDHHSHRIEEAVENIQAEVCGLPPEKK